MPISKGYDPETFEKAKAWFGGDELRARVFLDKYALRDYDGRVLEDNPEQMWRRVAREIASVERDEENRKLWEERFYWMLKDFKVVPGGRIMFGAGNPRKVTLKNCYVIPIKEDSIEGIFEAAKEMARTYSRGGGVGVDISVLRPAGAPVNNAAIFSTGSISFMDLFSHVTGTIGQQGRRGALMITINDDHPDVPEFITIKNDPERRRVRYANISVKVSNDLIEAVERDEEWVMAYESDEVGRIERRMPARDLWNLIIKNAWESAEPGIILWSNVKKYDTGWYVAPVISTNPCSEIPLEPYGACNLSNVNLSAFVLEPFSESARIDYESLERALRYNVRFLDDVNDYNMDREPLEGQREASYRRRRIGVGFTGLGDMLAKLRLRYDSDEAIEFVDRLFRWMKHVVYDEGVNLAVEKGTFPDYDGTKHLESPFFADFDGELLDRISRHGLRNIAYLTVPPVGSGSLLAGTSSGIEPIFALYYIRRAESLSASEFRVYHPLARQYMEMLGKRDMDEEEFPDYFITAHRIDPEKRVKMQAVIQKHIDQAISSTINLPRETTPEEIGRIYTLAAKSGLKGVTVYREGSREGILITESKPKEEKTTVRVRKKISPKPRPMVMVGKTYKFKTEMGTVYITVNTDGENGPKEVFIHLGKSGSSLMAMSEAIGRLISLALRSDVSPDAIIHQLKGIKSSSPVRQPDGSLVWSVPDAIARALETFLESGALPVVQENERPKIGIVVKLTSSDEDVRYEVEAIREDGDVVEGVFCPECGERLINENGCWVCKNCGYSKCE
ncbi:MAG: adenosylcobalamin-dependent ribonucleoside-diphosphate reductase [Thermotogae bacterium]|nr:adenosylcobalamin-dependent ribonucleoside-diphosphate reductase [Thermotogota bacterium]